MILNRMGQPFYLSNFYSYAISLKKLSSYDNKYD